MKKLLRQKNKGYTLLFAVLVSALVLAIGISILNINKKELLLTAGERDSGAAFYAADSGLECALYADQLSSLHDVFNPSTDNHLRLGNNSNCDVPLTFSGVPPTFHTPSAGNPVIFTFEAKLSSAQSGGPCAIVTVTKTVDSNNNPKTVIDSLGYNTGWDSSANRCNIYSAKRLERAIEYTY